VDLKICATPSFIGIRLAAAVAPLSPLSPRLLSPWAAGRSRTGRPWWANMGERRPACDSSSLPVLLPRRGGAWTAGRRPPTAIVPVPAFHTGYRNTALQPGEIVARIRLPTCRGAEPRLPQVRTREAQAITECWWPGRAPLPWAGSASAACRRVAPLRHRPDSTPPIEAVRGLAMGGETADLAGRMAAARVTPRLRTSVPTPDLPPFAPFSGWCACWCSEMAR